MYLANNYLSIPSFPVVCKQEGNSLKQGPSSDVDLDLDEVSKFIQISGLIDQ